jgi:predicted phosphodiesterase
MILAPQIEGGNLSKTNMAAQNGTVIIAKNYRDQYGWDMPTLKLARIMYKDNNLSFKDLEGARSALRYLEGKAGKAKLVKGMERTADRPKNPYNLPKSEAEPFEPFIMPYYESVFVMNDIHLPYHDIDALTAAIDYGVSNKPKAVFLNGDILDFHGVSYFMKDPMKKRFSEELNFFADFMAKLNDIFKCKIYYKFGNHEERYDNFLYQKAHELKGVEEFELEEIIKKRAECEVIRDKKIVIINGLPYIHGHEYGRGAFSPVNAARGLFLQAKHSAVKGDCHTTSEHTEPNIMGKINTTYSIGALCGLTPKWLPLNKWNHGCAMHFNSSKGVYSLENKRIYKGKVL